jgi:hypothetical protein
MLSEKLRSILSGLQRHILFKLPNSKNWGICSLLPENRVVEFFLRKIAG